MAADSETKTEEVQPDEDEAPDRRRGALRVYLGAAPGVGKTYAMLGEAHRRLERGTDVVVGVVETYGRAKTCALLDGLEVIPQRAARYRDSEFSELDLDAVLARRPEVVLVDELAHTNVPGSRHAKRWQDVEELLAAGIDVVSTLNVQHLQSLNDVVEGITGTVQLETVPDEVVRAAGQIELVDITPEALRRRLAHGNVYPAQKIDAALGNYFRAGNLTALRELALLWVADEVDLALRRYRSEHQITDTWEARERVVAAITGGQESETLIRRARRVASRSGADLLVVHVLRADGLSDVPPDIVGRCRRIADQVGATFHTVVGDEVAATLLEFAHGVNATQLVLGSSRRSRLARLFDEGIGATTVRRSAGIDVHMVTHEQAAGRVRTHTRHLAHRRGLLAWLVAILLPALVCGLGVLVHDDFSQASCAVGFVLAIVVSAFIGGLGPALLASALSAALLAYFFIPPLYNLAIGRPRDLVALVLMVLVAVLVSLVVDRAARRTEQAARARTEAALLGSYARTVLTHPHPLVPLLNKVRENFGLVSVTLLEKHGGGRRRLAFAGADPGEGPADTEVPVTPEIQLALRGRALTAADRKILETAAGHALLALRQQRMAADAAQARRTAETAELRTALLSALGHDLRTPLTSIKTAVEGLRDPRFPPSGEDASELLATVDESASRLSALVENLLDSSRLAAGAVRPLLKPTGCEAVVSAALSGLEGVAAVAVQVAPELPPALVDAGLLERVVANLVDNAVRHGAPARPTATPGDTAVAVRASAHRGRVELRVVDRGRGLPKNGVESFLPFQRLGDRDANAGVGLGLSVARGFTEAMGGTLHAEDTPGGGLTMVVSLPAYREEERLP
jgi:two-component system, OmpR family, sensor histidine kinase KdpD